MPALLHFYAFVSQVISSLLSPRFGASAAGVRPFCAGHAAFLFICLPGDFFSFVSQCWCPPFSAGHAAILFICLPCDFLPLSSRFGACAAGVHPFPLAMQGFYSFVSQVISVLMPSRFGACAAGVRPFCAGHAAFLCICLPCIS